MSKRYSLWPREHGAYAQLAAPIVAALLMRVPTLPAVLLAVAAIAAFLANRPVSLLFGHHRRLRRPDRQRVTRRLALLGAISVAFSGAGLSLADLDVISVAALVALPVGGVIVLAWRSQLHSLAGELVAALALPAAAAPIAVASGTRHGLALEFWIAWSIGYAASVLAVHRVIARHRRAANPIDHVLGSAFTAVMISIAALGWCEPMLLLALPLIAVSVVLVVRPPRATRLRAVGFALVAASMASIAVAVVVT